MDSILLPNEVEMYIDAMTPQNMNNLGTTSWLEWHQRLQKLNQEALIEASALKEEYVKETLITFQKTNVLIHEAILINIWKYKVLPILLKLEPCPETTFICYSILYHEAVCVALLELVLFHPSCCETLQDASIDLLDYSYGLASHLLSVKPEEPKSEESTGEELSRQKRNLEFELGIRSLSIIRYLSENFDRLPLSVKVKMYSEHDVAILFTEILILKPWIKDGKIYTNGSWRTWDNEQLGQAEAQVWLTIRQLLLDEECPKMYQLTNSRRVQLSRLLPLMSPTLLDQLCPLIELKHWLCRASVMDATGAPAAARPLLLEPVLEIKEGILAQCGGKWKKVAERQVDVVFTSDKEVLKDVAAKLSDAYNVDLMEKFEAKSEANCSNCGKGAIQRCSRCKKASYCSRSCQVTHWQSHKEDCEKSNI